MAGLFFVQRVEAAAVDACAGAALYLGGNKSARLARELGRQTEI